MIFLDFCFFCIVFLPTCTFILISKGYAYVTFGTLDNLVILSLSHTLGFAKHTIMQSLAWALLFLLCRWLHMALFLAQSPLIYNKSPAFEVVPKRWIVLWPAASTVSVHCLTLWSYNQLFTQSVPFPHSLIFWRLSPSPKSTMDLLSVPSQDYAFFCWSFQSCVSQRRSF